MMAQEKITLEYQFDGDAPPDGWDACNVTCAASSRGACIIPDIDLAAMRTRLEEFGYKRQPLVKRQGQTWREVWAQEQS